MFREIGINCLKRSKIRKKEESFMKKIFKYLSLFAVACSLGLQGVNAVQVQSCGPNEEEHMNYYMFLEGEKYDGFKETLNNIQYLEQNPFGLYTGADKYNNIKGANYISHGQIAISQGAAVTTTTWSVEEYWARYYQSRKDSNGQTGMYTDPADKTAHYFYHSAWWQYTKPDFSDEPTQKNYSYAEQELMNWLADHYTKLNSEEGKPLINASMIPFTTTIRLPENMFGDMSETQRWRIGRTFNSTSAPQLPTAGINFGGTAYVFAPAAYYVKWCGPKVNQSGDKTLHYDPNTTDMVTNNPPDETFTDDKCATIAAGPVRSGYRFVGWSKTKVADNATVKTAEYQQGDSYCGESTTLYAVWEKVDNTKPYTVKYNANGGLNPPADQQGQAGECINLAKETPTKSGYTFSGWSTNEKASAPNKQYDPGSRYCGPDITLYAVYTPNNPKTGVSPHIVAFALVGVAAGIALFVAKKKNLFKQI